MKKIFPLFTLICLLFPPIFTERPTDSVQAAVKMPGFTLPDATSGRDVKSDDFTGKAMLVTFFASWCPTCIQEIPTLVRVHQEFAAKGFSVLGLSVDQGGAAVVQRLMRRTGINFPVLMADMSTAENFGGVYMIPVSFLVNKAGQVVKKYPGPAPESVLAKDIRGVLQ
ncbi:MAG: TlpA family protein disulfide reductase [Desulfobulbaceae bacterium]|nr:TlpA family protein disulfide reductase [Desulfobulbaceae bacterium]